MRRALNLVILHLYSLSISSINPYISIFLKWRFLYIFGHTTHTQHDADVLLKYGNTSVGAMYMAHLAANMSCDAVARCRLDARNTLQKKLVEVSEHGIPISFVTESLHSPMLQQRQRRAMTMHASTAAAYFNPPSPCAAEIAKVCPHLTGVACKTCVAKHSAAVTAACPTPGQVDKVRDVMGYASA